MGDWLNNPELKRTNVSKYNKNHLMPSSEGQIKKLEEIRQLKYVEPEDTGENHPQNLYIILGHGSEDTRSKRKVVPKGCILVVKSHSGENTLVEDLVENQINILDIKNKETVFDPVSHKKELFTILTAKEQAERSHTDINVRDPTNSTAIYREGDTYNDFMYSLFSWFNSPPPIISSAIYHRYNKNNPNTSRCGHSLEDRYSPSGLYKMKFKDTYDNSLMNNVCPRTIPINRIFKRMFGLRMFSHLKDVISLFRFSTAYEYFYTKEYINDIITIIYTYVKNGIGGDIGINKVKDMFPEKYLKISKRINNDLITLFKKHSIPTLELGLYPTANNFNEYVKQKEILEKYIKNPETIPFEFCEKISIKNFMNFIGEVTIVWQSRLFKDVEEGLLEPGVFYNIVCRYTEHSTNNGFLSVKYIEDSKHYIPVHSEAPEVRNRISEAILQREDQAREVFGNRTNTGKTYKRIANNNKIRWVENTPPNVSTRRRKRKNRKTRHN